MKVSKNITEKKKNTPTFKAGLILKFTLTWNAFKMKENYIWVQLRLKKW